jgi:hypothetical protein
VLKLDDAREESQRSRSVDRARCLVCPDCGTYWRVWRTANVARPYFDTPAEPRALLRAPERDIDVVIAQVRSTMAGVEISQLRQAWPDDDDAVWLFELPGETRNVQIDGAGAYGQCPFVLEHSGMMHVADRKELHDPRDIATKITAYLAGLRR